MKKFSDSWKSNILQPQVFSLMFVTLILVILSIVIYRKVKKQKPSEAPTGFLLVSEIYVTGIDSLYKQSTSEKFSKPGPYIFTLITLLGFSNMLGLLGLEPAATSYSVTLTLALVSWIGIYVVGLMYQKIIFFKKYLNPVEVIGQFAPLISLSFRLFGNLTGGATIMYLLYGFTGYIWGSIPVIGEVNILGSMIAPVFHIYFDLFSGLIQAFVFTLLTMIYWVIEAEEKEVEVELNQNKETKVVKTNNKTEAIKA